MKCLFNMRYEEKFELNIPIIIILVVYGIFNSEPGWNGQGLEIKCSNWLGFELHGLIGSIPICLF